MLPHSLLVQVVRRADLPGLAVVAVAVAVAFLAETVAGFLAAIAVRATGWLSADALSMAKQVEQNFLTAGMFGLGAGIDVGRLRRLGGCDHVIAPPGRGGAVLA